MSGAALVNMTPPPAKRTHPSSLGLLQVIDRGIEPYPETLAFQEHLVEQRQAGRIPDTLILVEHPSVMTLGRNATTDNLLTPADELAALGIPVIRTTRGGQITYHGPGQLVLYPIMELTGLDEGPIWYVGKLEDVLIQTLAALGLTATGDSKDRGVWVGSNKIAAIGVRITRHITLHGVSLNVRVDLEPYRHIIPCGIRDRGITSLHLLQKEISLDKVKRQVVQDFLSVFSRTLSS